MSRYKVSDEARVNASLGHHLGKAIDASGRSVHDVAHTTGIGERRLRSIIAGAVSCDLPELARLCLATGVMPDAIVAPALKAVPVAASL